MGSGDHRSGAEDESQLLVESVGVGVAGVVAGDDFGGHRGSAEDELSARGVGEARGVASYVLHDTVSMMDTMEWSEGDREHVGDELHGGGCG